MKAHPMEFTPQYKLDSKFNLDHIPTFVPTEKKQATQWSNINEAEAFVPMKHAL
jgi:hypothetical protein